MSVWPPNASPSTQVQLASTCDYLPVRLAMQMPKQMCFLLYDFLEFSLVKSSKIFNVHRMGCEFKCKKVGFVQAVFSSFADLYLSLLRKNGCYRFPCKTSSDQSKISTTRAPNFTKFYRRKRGARKFTVSFAYRETLTFSFERAQIT